MHYVVDFQVDWPKLLFKSRPQLPCRDIIHVATSILRRDINLSLCSFQLMSSDVATPISCRDITLCLCRFQLVAHDVATSNLLSRHQLKSSAAFNWSFVMSRPQSLVGTPTYVFGAFTGCCWCRDNSLSYISFIFPNLSCLQGASLVATSIPCRDINFCRDITMLSRHHSFSLCLSLSCLSCDPCRDQHQIPSIFLMSRPHN